MLDAFDKRFWLFAPFTMVYVLNPGISLNYNKTLPTTIKYCYNVYSVNAFKIV